MKKNKIILIGNILNTFSLLKIILIFKKKFDIFVITNKNKKKSDYFDLSRYCKKKKIFHYITKNVHNYQTVKKIKSFQPDYIFCFGWSQILKKIILKEAKKFCVGYHPGKLPENKGKHPLIWAITLGLNQTASTFFKLTNKVDDGNIISQKKIIITKKDNAKTLYRKMQTTSCAQLKDILKKLNSSRLQILKKEKCKTNIWRKRNFQDGVIDWRMSSKNIENLVKALYHPYPFAGTFYKNKYISIKKVKTIKKKIQNAEFGKIIYLNKHKPHVKCGDNIIEIVNYEPKIKFKLNNYFD
jgi:methionyl-tRNA formyltransferase